MKIFNRLLDTAMDQVDKRVDQSKDAINERYEDAMRRAEELIFEAKCVVAVGVIGCAYTIGMVFVGSMIGYSLGKGVDEGGEN